MCLYPARARKKIAQVGTISSNGEKSIGEMIANGMENHGARQRLPDDQTLQSEAACIAAEALVVVS